MDPRYDAAPDSPDAMPVDAMPPAMPTLVVSTKELSVVEGDAAGATFTVMLSEAPGADVEVTLGSSDDSIVRVSPAALRFDDSDYSSAQTVTVTAVDDDDAGNHAAMIAISAAGLDGVTVAVTVMDDEVLAIVPTTTAVTMAEGGTASFEVRLTAAPAADLTVMLGSSDPSVVAVDTAMLVFTAANFATPQAVTIRGLADADVADGSATLTLSAPGLADVSVAVTVADDDTLTILASPSVTSVNEGEVVTVDYSLSHDPLGTVDITIGSSDELIATVSPASLRFDSSNYGQAQSVVVSTAFDSSNSDEAVTITASTASVPGVADVAVPVTVVDTTPYLVELFVRATFNEFGLDNPLVFEGGAGYSALIPLDAGFHQLKIADAGSTPQTTFSVNATAATSILLDTPTRLEQVSVVDSNTLLDIDVPGTYRFVLEASDPGAPVLTISLAQPAPLATNLFVRGTFNFFSVSDPLRFQGRGRYTAQVPLRAGTHELKIADQDFAVATTFSVSDTMAAVISLGTPTPLVQSSGTGNNTVLVTTQPGMYMFELEVTDAASPVLTVSLAAPAPLAVDLYVRGSFNGFSTADPLPYERGVRYSTTVLLDAGDHTFKIADAGFTDAITFSVDRNGVTSIALDTPTALMQAPGLGNDTLVTIPQRGLYSFELEVNDTTAPVLTISRRSPPYTSALYVRGSFNGFSAADAMSYDGEASYSALVSLDAGAHELKISDALFSQALTFSIDPAVSMPILLSSPTVLVQAPGTGNNMMLDITTPGIYRFELLVWKLEMPILTVTLQE